MASLTVSFKYVTELTGDELRVIGLALSGRLKDRKDIELAHDLNQRLMVQRARFAEQFAEQVKGAAVNAAEDTVEAIDGRLTVQRINRGSGNG